MSLSLNELAPQFQVIRRTIATLAKGHVKGIQGMMRRSQVSTTTNVYMQILQPEVRSTVDSIHRELSRKTVPATSPEPMVPAVQSPDGPTVEEVLTASAALTINAADEVAATRAKPARGAVLEFATKMRQRTALSKQPDALIRQELGLQMNHTIELEFSVALLSFSYRMLFIDPLKIHKSLLFLTSFRDETLAIEAVL